MASDQTGRHRWRPRRRSTLNYRSMQAQSSRLGTHQRARSVCRPPAADKRDFGRDLTARVSRNFVRRARRRKNVAVECSIGLSARSAEPVSAAAHQLRRVGHFLVALAEVVSRHHRDRDAAGHRFQCGPEFSQAEFVDNLPDTITPDDVRRTLNQLAQGTILVPIFDEFDRIHDGQIRTLMADTVKALSDYSVQPRSSLSGLRTRWPI